MVAVQRGSSWQLRSPLPISASQRSTTPVQRFVKKSAKITGYKFKRMHALLGSGTVRSRGSELQPRTDVELAASLIPKAAAGSPGGTETYSIESKPSLTAVLISVAIASMGAFAFGYHLGVVNGPLAAVAQDLGFGGNAALQGAVVSSTLAGAAVGSITGGDLANTLGRRTTLLLDAIPLLVGTLLSATATNLAGMIAGRLIVGVGIGLSSALVPLYISEVAPTEVRGTLGSINQLVICIGILAALVANVAIPATSWRLMFYLATVPAIILAAGMFTQPESPRWLQSKGRSVEALATATKLWGSTGASQLDATPVGDERKADSVSLGELLGNKGTRIGVTLFAAQQLSGINAIIYFSSSVFADAGIRSGALASALVGTVNVFMTVIAASLMDKAGRKQLLTISFSGMAAAMLAMSAGLGLPQLAHVSGTVALVGTLVYVACFALGAGAVPGLIVPELTPARLRGRAVSAAMVSHWVLNLAIGQLFLPAVTRFGISAVYLFFTAVCVLTVLYTKAQVVETKGLSLEEIERQLNS